MIRFACGTCKEKLLVPDRHAGRKGKCPNCGTINRVPLVSEFPDPPRSATAEPVAVAAPSATAPVAVPSSRTAETRVAEPPPADRLGMAPATAPRPQGAVTPAPVQTADPAPVADGPRQMVEVNPLDDAGMAPALKLLVVLGILAVIVLGVWVVFYLLVWSQIKLST